MGAMLPAARVNRPHLSRMTAPMRSRMAGLPATITAGRYRPLPGALPV
jgi:hypothetical protein